jgi:hypothetical protein
MIQYYYLNCDAERLVDMKRQLETNNLTKSNRLGLIRLLKILIDQQIIAEDKFKV